MNGILFSVLVLWVLGKAKASQGVFVGYFCFLMLAFFPFFMPAILFFALQYGGNRGARFVLVAFPHWSRSMCEAIQFVVAILAAIVCMVLLVALSFAPAPKRLSMRSDVRPPLLDTQNCARPNPEYPKESRNNSEAGTGVMQIHINEIGMPDEFLIIKSTGSERFDTAVKKWAMNCRFRPQMEDGMFTEGWTTQTFTLSP